MIRKTDPVHGSVFLVVWHDENRIIKWETWTFDDLLDYNSNIEEYCEVQE